MSTDSHGDPTITSAAAAVARWRVASEASRADLERFLPPTRAPHRLHVLCELVAAELESRIRAGQQARVEEYLEKYPELGEDQLCLPELVALELKARRQAGETVTETDYRQRFPRVLGEWVAPRPAAVEPPPAVDPDHLQPGDKLGDFRIVRLLGRGSYARVYLAHETSLDRRVALKVAANGQDGTADEARALARLDHPNIVPVYSEHTLSGRRAIVMRYVAGRTLAEWMETRPDVDLQRWRGRDLLNWLRGPHGGNRNQDESHADSLVDERLPSVACRLVLDLARALQHAHERGVLHLDIKPSNVLLDRNGRALLMDFNVAAVHASSASATYVGGTLGYMPPEQLARFAGTGPQLPARIDTRSDLFALGTLFYELLSGVSPWPLPHTSDGRAGAHQLLALRLRGVPALEKIPVSPGLRSIVAKCLEPRAADRYPSAAALAEDLRRWLGHRPLQTATDPSLWERSRKWRRRHPRLMAASLAVLLFASLLLFRSGWSDLRRLQQLHSQLDVVEADYRAGERTAAIERFQQLRGELNHDRLLPAWCLLGWQDAAERRVAALSRRIANDQSQSLEAEADARRAVASAAGVDTAINPLELYSVKIPEDWRQHYLLQSLTESRRTTVYETVTEILLVQWQTARIQHQLDSDARKIFFQRLPAPHADLPLIASLGRQTEQRPLHDVALDKFAEHASSSFEHYLLGVLAMIRRDWEQGRLQFRNALAADGSRFWARFYLGMACTLDPQQEHQELAIASFATCIGMRPDFALAHIQLGQLYARTEALDLARENLQRAVELAPDHAGARIQLGKLLQQLDQPQEALEQLLKAAELRPQSAMVHRELASTYRSLHKPQQAVKHLQLAVDAGGRRTELRVELARTYLTAEQLDRAIAEYCEILRSTPAVPGLYLQFVDTLRQRNQLRGALDVLNGIIAERPRDAAGYLLRASVHRALRDTRSARQDITTAIRIDPNSIVARQWKARIEGMADRRLLSDRPQTD